MNKRVMQFRIYRDDDDQWRWRLVASNGKIFADSAEGYKRRCTMIKVINAINQGGHLIAER